MIYLDLADLLAAAKVALQQKPVVRDYGLLESALARPQATVFGEDAYPDIHLKAAALLQSLTCNHGLIDRNKRTALAATLLFYALNGYRLTSTPDAYDLMIDVASGTISDAHEIARRLSTWPQVR